MGTMLRGRLVLKFLVGSGQIVGRMLSGDYVERMLSVELALKQLVRSGQIVGKMLSGDYVESTLMIVDLALNHKSLHASSG